MPADAVGYLWSMRDNVWTRPGRWRSATVSKSVYSRGTIARPVTRNSMLGRIPLCSVKTPGQGIDGVGQETTWYVP